MGHKVSFLVPFAFGMGGIPRHVFRIGGELAARGHEVEVLSVVRRTDQPFFPVHPGIALDALIDLRDPANPGHALQRPRKRPGSWSRQVRLDRRPSGLTDDSHRVFSALTDRLLRKHLSAMDDGVIVATRPELAVAAVRWAGPQVVTVLHELNSIVDRDQGLLDAVRAITRPDAPRPLDALVTLTEPELQRWREAIGPTATQLGAVPPANPFSLGPQAALDSRTVVAAGRLTRQKGFDLLIRAWKGVALEHPDWTLEIYGTGQLHGPLLKLAEDQGVASSVVLRGASNDMEAVMSGASVFALSSRFEGFGLVILEAMSKGVPVASFDCPEGPATLIDDDVNGLLIPNGDVEALSAGLLRLVESHDLRLRIGGAGMVRAADFDIARVTDTWEALFDDLAARAARRR